VKKTDYQFLADFIMDFWGEKRVKIIIKTGDGGGWANPARRVVRLRITENNDYNLGLLAHELAHCFQESIDACFPDKKRGGCIPDLKSRWPDGSYTCLRCGYTASSDRICLGRKRGISHGEVFWAINEILAEQLGVGVVGSGGKDMSSNAQAASRPAR